MIAESKTDKVDAAVLSHLLRGDLIAECYVHSMIARLSRALLGHKVSITKEHTRARNRIHSLLDKYDIKCQYSDISCKQGLAWLKSVTLEGHDQEILQSLVRQLEFLRGEECKANNVIAKDATNNGGYVLIIMSTPGFDYYAASFLAACIADISRFPTPSRLVCG